MNRKNLLLLLFITPLTSYNVNIQRKLLVEYDVSEFYIATEPEDSDTKVITTSGDIEEIELVLVPTEMEEGVYEIEITRKESNIYKLEGTKYYIQTRYCYEYATYDDAILKVESNYGYTKGKIYFK